MFFKGCPLNCHWCHNPETQSYDREFYYHKDRCNGCRSCVENCSVKAIQIRKDEIYTDMNLCTGCKICMECCIQGARELVGRTLTAEELIKELKKDTAFYEESGGGITLSGGEVMTIEQSYLIDIMKPLHKQGYRIGIDTCGFASFDRFEEILPYTEFFLYDVKGMDSVKHEQYTGVKNELILDNLKKLSMAGAKIYLRIPVINDVNASLEDMKAILHFIKEEKIQIIQIHLLPYHGMGNNKYIRLNRNGIGESFTLPTEQMLEEYRHLFFENGYRTVIGG